MIKMMVSGLKSIFFLPNSLESSISSKIVTKVDKEELKKSTESYNFWYLVLTQRFNPAKPSASESEGDQWEGS